MTGQEAKDWLRKEIKGAELFGKHAGECVTRSYRKTELEEILEALENTEKDAYRKGYEQAMRDCY